MLDEVIKLAKAASEKILEIYDAHTYTVSIKEDDSPLTQADIASNKIIQEGLAKLSDIPVISEETFDFEKPRPHYEKFWLVDPLDGTKDFIARNGQFTVNIALVENRVPVLGVVAIPVSGDVFYAEKGKDAFQNGTKISCENISRKEVIGTDSCFHSTEQTLAFFKEHNITNIKKFGSSIKLCKIAAGEIDIYPRLNGTKEWDTAAGHVILNEAGGEIIDLVTNREMEYDKPSVKNNFFIAKRKGLRI
ncbi:MAG: 3'(2'),5'-bisphosphate nucleotidase CysQ [Alphaproteobacteria bacterium]|nr:3'(2'),5'-bisphosphate nucleotidase CysQ [Alphaproteobacteria bacterium]